MNYTEIKDYDLSKLHKIEIELLDELVKICQKHNSKYYLMYGSLLGAVRHKGFIPWDDDLDVAMTRDDYEKFIEVAPYELNDKYYLDCREYNKQFHLPFAKLKKNHTTFCEKQTRANNDHKGIFIDIFPLDNIKNPYNLLTKIRSIIIRNIIEVVFVKMKFLKLKECRNSLFCLFLLPFSVDRLYNIHYKLMTKDNLKDTDFLVSFCGVYPILNELIKRDNLKQNTYVFENKKYTSFKNSDDILSPLYGEYKKLPPAYKRINHNPVKIDFEKGKTIITKKLINNRKEEYNEKK